MMIRTKLIYDGNEIFINPFTISYIIKQDNNTVIGLTNGHTYTVTASAQELLEGCNNEIKCNGCRD